MTWRALALPAAPRTSSRETGAKPRFSAALFHLHATVALELAGRFFSVRLLVVDLRLRLAAASRQARAHDRLVLADHFGLRSICRRSGIGAPCRRRQHCRGER